MTKKHESFMGPIYHWLGRITMWLLLVLGWFAIHTFVQKALGNTYFAGSVAGIIGMGLTFALSKYANEKNKPLADEIEALRK
jgi:FtsH-binding integral membrane protein